ncbi:MAG: class D sortase [Acidobacteriaceae bacterium]|nr:class D sortase [Acidobacteriaceae bacterium]
MTTGPVLVRVGLPPKPGLHSHSRARRLARLRSLPRPLLLLRTVLVIFGVAALGYYMYAVANEYVYQVYENWAFDQQIAGRPLVTFADYMGERTPFGFLVGGRNSEPTAPVTKAVERHSAAPGAPRPETGSVLGKVNIDRLKLSAIVREGVDNATLSKAVGHVPSTVLPGEAGNFAIAAHRDTLFRALKDIHNGDIVTFEAPAGAYQYQVFSTRIVKPSDVRVLQPDGGLPNANDMASAANAHGKLLTMITCYPFYYVGSAPKRFIVQARLILSPAASPPPQVDQPAVAVAKPATATRSISLAQNRVPAADHAHTVSYVSRPVRRIQKAQSGAVKPKRHGFWHKVFRFS